MPRKTPRDVAMLLAGLDEAFDSRSWHGTNLFGSIRGLGVQVAVWRPARGRHNIWEIIVHAAYWKYAVTRRLTGAKRGGFPLSGSNWFPRPEDASLAALRGDVRLLKACHAALCEAVAGLGTRDLRRRAKGSRWTVEESVRGVAAHDIYHAGQIQLIKRLAR